MAANRNIGIEVDVSIDDTERNRILCSILVSDDVLRVEEVDALVRRGIASERHTLLPCIEGLHDTLLQSTVEDRRLGRRIPDKLTRLGTDLYDRTVVDDDHTLTFVHRDDRAVRDEVIRLLRIKCSSRLPRLALLHEDVFCQRIAVKIFTPLIRKNRFRSA